jgi:phospholipase/carboxylesterase
MANQTRRQLLLASLMGSSLAAMPALAAMEKGRLSARLYNGERELYAPGEHVLADNNGRRHLLYIPTSAAGKPAPFVLFLHGARGDGDRNLAQERAAADANGVIVLSPSSSVGTWDAIQNSFADDLVAVDALLQKSFDGCLIDPTRVAVGGMSDGASYGLTLGLINGDLFTHVIAHSPGFIITDNWHGKPKVFVSHGRQDNILPFEQCGAAIVARLKKSNYDVRFDIFDGGHTATPEMRSTALGWMKS